MAINRATSRLLSGTAVVAGGILAGRVLGLVRELVIAHYFGASAITDALVVAITFPDVVSVVLGGGALSAAIVPVVSSLVAAQDPERERAVIDAMLSAVLVAGVVTTVLGVLFAPWLITALAPGMAGATRATAIPLLRLAMWSVGLSLVTAAIGGLLNVRHHFLVPAFGTFAYNAGLLLAMVAGVATLGATAAALGVTLGSVLRFGTHVVAFRRLGFRFRFRFPWPPDPALKRMLYMFVPVVVGYSVFSINVLAHNALASFLPDGSIAVINYASRVVKVPTGIFASAVAVSAFPALAAAIQRCHWQEVRDSTRTSVRFVLLTTLPIAAVLLAVPELIVDVLYRRGAFDQAALASTSRVLFWYAWGIPFQGLAFVYTRVHHAAEDARTPLLLDAATVLANVAGAAAMLPWLGLVALPVATSVSALGNCLALAWSSHRLVERFAREHPAGVDAVDAKAPISSQGPDT